MRPPRETLTLVGHTANERLVSDALSGDRVPQAWLLTGPPGVGKATFAYRMARFLLTGGGADSGPSLFGDSAPVTSLTVEADHPAVRQIAVGSHPDLLVIEREMDEKRDKMKSAISVDQVREISQFLHLTASQGGWRIVLIDSADEMNTNAANALLKILEEPPKRALLILVSHTPGRLLPTIRSRCRLLRFGPLSAEDARGAAQAVLDQNAQDEAKQLALTEKNPSKLAEALEKARYAVAEPIDPIAITLADGAPGRALMLADPETRSVLTDLLGLLRQAPNGDPAALHGFAEKLGKAAADAQYRSFIDQFDAWLMRVIRHSARTGSVPNDLPGEAQAAEAVLRAAGSLDRLIEVWEKNAQLFRQTDGLNLDRKQAVLSALLPLTQRR